MQLLHFQVAPLRDENRYEGVVDKYDSEVDEEQQILNRPDHRKCAYTDDLVVGKAILSRHPDRGVYGEVADANGRIAGKRSSMATVGA
jgi:hypothetical protein